MSEIVIFTGDNDDEVLRRQIHPNHFVAGSRTQLERTAFTPRWATDEPDGRMSHLRDVVDAVEAWCIHTEDYNKASAGTWGIQVGEARSLGLACGDDSGLKDRPDHHSFIELHRVPGRWKDLARRLAEFASQRGALHPRPTTDST